MAGLFVWWAIQDKTKNSQLLQENTKTLEIISQSSEKIAKTLETINNNTLTLDVKVERNYQELIKK